MKKMYIILAVAATVLAAGCSKESVQNTASGRINITFEAQNAKSVIAADGKSIEWASKDIMDIYDGTSANKFTYSSSKFSGSVKEGSTKFYAVYPALHETEKGVLKRSVSKFEANAETLEMQYITYLPSCQKATANSFAPFANISACEPVLSGDKLVGTMQNLCAYIKFTVTTDNLKKVLITSVDNKKLSGYSIITFGEEGIAIEGKENTYVQMCSFADGNKLSAGTYYAVILPGEFTKGFKVTMTDDKGSVYEYTTPKGVTLAPGQTANLGTIDGGLDAKKTSSLSLYYDFSNRANMTGFPSSNTETNLSLTVNGTTYTTAIKGVYSTSASYATINGSSASNAYLTTPAIEGMTLTQAIVTWRGHNANYKTQMKIWDGATGSTYQYSGSYKLGTLNWANKVNSTFMVADQILYISHIFRLGKNGDGELNIATKDMNQPEPNTSYRVRSNMNGPSCAMSIELIYEAAEE